MVETPFHHPIFSLGNPDTFKIQMEVAGFTEVEVEYVTREMVLDDFTSICAMLTVGALPIKMIFHKVGAEGKIAFAMRLPVSLRNVMETARSPYRMKPPLGLVVEFNTFI